MNNEVVKNSLNKAAVQNWENIKRIFKIDFSPVELIFDKKSSIPNPLCKKLVQDSAFIAIKKYHQNITKE